ncbi:EAL domain-containing response regulator [Shewanella sp. GutDb-MelDb]|uniref:EAL domain-containing response regulator n=1 Tax=Shewanella sp. GutDb-MelDb TaxID=2058316 RepID=UPI0015E09B15|nr:EAL domain-containing response regulator [Shewanella sp. GutDb-MelDb]
MIHKHYKILNIEDDLLQLKSNTFRLEYMGFYNIVEHSNAEDALLETLSTDFDLVITDIDMPGLSGLDLISSLSTQCKNYSVLVITGMDKSIIDLVNSMATHLGFNNFEVIAKPLQTDKFEKVINRISNKNSTDKGKRSYDLTSLDLRKAILNNELINVYQPQVSFNNKRVVSVEALVRWKHPQYGLLAPVHFLHLLDNHGMHHSLFISVFRNAIHDLNINNIKYNLSVNVSQEVLEHHSIFEEIKKIAKYGMFDLNRLTVELTESGAYTESLQMLLNLSNLHLHGIKLSIDDFGTGNSSLEKLSNYPFSELKIDRKFISSSVTNNVNRIITEVSCNLAKQLGLTIVAEGVEDKITYDYVKSLGANLCQGYFTGKPVSAFEIATLQSQ